jgi:hypothetical protein
MINVPMFCRGLPKLEVHYYDAVFEEISGWNFKKSGNWSLHLRAKGGVQYST